MPVKKPSAKPTKAKKTVSARPAAKAAVRAPVKPAPKARAKGAPAKGSAGETDREARPEGADQGRGREGCRQAGCDDPP